MKYIVLLTLTVHLAVSTDVLTATTSSPHEQVSENHLNHQDFKLPMQAKTSDGDYVDIDVDYVKNYLAQTEGKQMTMPASMSYPSPFPINPRTRNLADAAKEKKADNEKTDTDNAVDDKGVQNSIDSSMMERNIGAQITGGFGMYQQGMYRPTQYTPQPSIPYVPGEYPMISGNTPMNPNTPIVPQTNPLYLGNKNPAYTPPPAQYIKGKGFFLYVPSKAQYVFIPHPSNVTGSPPVPAPSDVNPIYPGMLPTMAPPVVPSMIPPTAPTPPKQEKDEYKKCKFDPDTNTLSIKVIFDNGK